MKILITGANGLLGQKLVQLMTQPPYSDTVQVMATGRGANRLPAGTQVAYTEMDITDAVQVQAVLHDTKPDVVIHTAAMTQVDDCESQREACWAMNVLAVQYIVEACAAVGAFLLHVSTDFIFDGAAGPYNEEAKPAPLSYYGESKLAAEEIVRHSAIDWAIARTILVYGVTPAMSRSNIILWVRDSLRQGKTIRVVNDQWRTPTLAEDLAMGCWLIARARATGIYNIAGKELLTPYDMAIATARYFHLDEGLIVQTDASEFTQPARRPPRTGLLIDKAQTLLGYAPHSFVEGIAMVAAQVGKQ